VGPLRRAPELDAFAIPDHYPRGGSGGVAPDALV